MAIDMVVTLKRLIGIKKSLGQLDIIAEGDRAQAVYHDIGHQPGKSCIS